MKVLQFAKFFFISVPLACVIFCTVNAYYELKLLTKRNKDARRN